MPIDPSFIELNHASTERIRALAARLSDGELLHPVGPDWTVSILLAHLAFWDRRVLYVVEMSQRQGKLVIPDIGAVANDLSLPLWAAIPPRAAAHLAIETAETTDAQLAACPPELLEQMVSYYPRWVLRALHRNEHLDEAEAALTAKS